MTQILRIAMAQFDFPVGAVAQNSDNIRRMIAEARDEYGADVVLFPELAVSGYPPEDLLLRPRFLADCETALTEIAATTHGIVAVVGWPQSAGSVVYNAASVLRDGVIETTYRKRELPNYAVFDERRYFDVDPDGGACTFEVKGVPLGLVICEDLWFPEPRAGSAAAGAPSGFSIPCIIWGTSIAAPSETPASRAEPPPPSPTFEASSFRASVAPTSR